MKPFFDGIAFTGGKRENDTDYHPKNAAKEELPHRKMEERSTAEEISMKVVPQNLTAKKVALKTIMFQPDSSQCMTAL